MGIPVMKLIFPAAMLGMLPPTKVGLLMTVPAAGVAYDDCVATEDVELDRVGEEGRFIPGGGDGATAMPLEEVR
jgi:hypothetical protein